jgi:RNA polymerase sigma factor (sigma-70 family)
MHSRPLTIFIVDDDPGVRDSIGLMLGLVGFRTAMFADAESFLAAYQEDWAGCVVADLKLPGKSGIELQAELRARGSTLPVVIITAHGDVPTARAAFQAQAVDFLEKPFDDTQLRAAIDTAFALEERRIQRADDQRSIAERLAKLTMREREIMEHAGRGLHAKEIATALGISPRTVEVHKARLMAKLGVRSVADLVRFTLTAKSQPNSEAGYPEFDQDAKRE